MRWLLTTWFLLAAVRAKGEERECRLVDPMRVEDLLSVGQHLKADNGRPFNEFPCWFNPELARVGQRFAKANFGHIFMAHAFSLIPLLSDKQSQRVLLLSGRSTTPKRAFKRYVATAQQVHLWYHHDVLGPNWIRSVENIRHIHRAASELVRRKGNSSLLQNALVTYENNTTGFVPNEKMWRAFKQDLEEAITSSGVRIQRVREMVNGTDPKLLLNQYTMTITLWGFMALPVLIPQELGIAWTRYNEEDLQGFAHLWAIIGYLLGMDEEFILCRDVNNWSGCKDYLQQIFVLYLVPQMLELDFEGQIMVESLLQGINNIIPPFPVDSLLINFIEAACGTWATHLRRQRSFLSFFYGTGGNFFLKGPVMLSRIARWFMNFLSYGELQVASKKTFGDPGTNSTVVALTHFYLDD